MNGDYEGLLRRVIGEPTVSSALWGIVTSVSEGDEDAYADALVAIGREFGYYCLEPVIEDWRTPGVVLDAILGGWPTVYKNLWELVTSVGEGDAHMYGEVLLALDWLSWRDFESREYDTAQFRWAYMMLSDDHVPGGALETLFSNGRVCNGFRASIAAHKNITERLERDALRSKSALVREALAGNTSISEDAVAVLRKSKSKEVIGNLLSNSVLDGEALRDLVEYARRIGMGERAIATRGCKNVSMPVGVVLEWADDATLRQYVLGSPVLPREELVRLLLEGVDDNLEVAARYAFEPWSNADGQIIDWYVNMWFRSAESSSRFHDNVGVERALSHPRTWGSTLERVYARYGGDGKYGRGMVKSILRSPSCPDWVRWDVLSRGDKSLIGDAARESESVPHGFARALADNGYWEEAVDCPNAPGDVLADAVEHIVNLYKWQGESSLAEHQLGCFLASENMPPEVRRACARWSHVSLWAVARDGFLGRI